MDQYLVQALRAYRLESEGQFGEVTRHVLPLTQDAANRIEQLNIRIAELEKGLLISFGAVQAEEGLIGVQSWPRIKALLEAGESPYRIAAIRAIPDGLRLLWLAPTQRTTHEPP